MVVSGSGLEWRKFDLHVHTPASKDDYINKSATPSEIISKCQELQLDAICPADHNTGAWVDELKKAAEGTGIVVYPGVEITAHGGERNVHILAIFDPSKSKVHINDLLSKLHITEDERGRTDVLARGDVNQVIDLISESGGIPLLAHADSRSGVLEEIRGVARTKIVRNLKLLGAQITKDETAVFLDGSDPNYKRKLATFKTSDAHDVDGIGGQTTYFKIGAMTISALRQCFIDPDTRIRWGEVAEPQYPRILSIEYSEGFLGGQKCEFHNGLNSIIGGKGVGKSLVIEFLRFVLNQPSSIPPIVEDMYGKLKEQLGIGGTITAYVRTQSGIDFTITRQYDNIDNPTTVINVADDTPYEGEVSRLFPVSAYSQNEIIDISRDLSAQLNLIDKLVDITSYNAAIGDIQGRLRRNVNRYLESLIAKQETLDITREITTLEQEISELDKLLSDPMFGSKKEWDHKRAVIELLHERAESLMSEAQQFLDTTIDVSMPTLSEKDKEQSDLVSYHEIVCGTAKDLISNFQAALDKFRVAVQEASKHEAEFRVTLSRFEEDYRIFIETVGGQKQALAARRTRRQRELQKHKDRLAELRIKADRFQSIEEERQELLDSLDQSLNQRYQARAEVYEKLTAMSAGRLRLIIKENADRESYCTALMNLAYGTRIRQLNLGSICDALSPRQLVDHIINRRVGEIAKEADLTPESATKLIEACLSSEARTRDLLELPIENILQDLPRIEYLKEDGKYYPLNQLSVGQKCTALLLIALSEGIMPIIVDQPEDAIDVATIYYDVVSRLRNRKENRQFILTTHNPNIAVTSDSDKYHVLKATESTGEIVCCGAIDLESVRKAVIDHLEGGIDPYTLRGKKYDLT